MNKKELGKRIKALKNKINATLKSGSADTALKKLEQSLKWATEIYNLSNNERFVGGRLYFFSETQSLYIIFSNGLPLDWSADSEGITSSSTELTGGVALWKWDSPELTSQKEDGRFVLCTRKNTIHEILEYLCERNLIHSADFVHLDKFEVLEKEAIQILNNTSNLGK